MKEALVTVGAVTLLALVFIAVVRYLGYNSP
jgi:Ni/Fe-hydrogenase subunit HybB-like protein